MKLLISLMIFVGLVQRPITDGGEVPAPIQAAIIKRVVEMEKKLSQKSDLKVAVVSSGNNSELPKQLVAGLKKVELIAEEVELSKLNSVIESFDIVYAVGDASKEVGQTTQTNSKLSVTNSIEAVQSGYITLGITLSEGKPKLVVSKKCAKSENQDFIEQFFKFATVIE